MPLPSKSNKSEPLWNPYTKGALAGAVVPIASAYGEEAVKGIKRGAKKLGKKIKKVSKNIKSSLEPVGPRRSKEGVPVRRRKK
jgi:hypothetical protein